MTTSDRVPLLLLPGLDGTGRLFAPLLPLLPERLVPIVIPYPSNELLGYRELVDLVRRQLPPAGPFVMLAESFSGPIAVELAAERPDGLAAVILCATFATNPTPFPPAWSRLISARLFAAKPSAYLVRRFLIGSDASDTEVAEVIATIRSVAPKVLADRVRSVMRVDVLDRMPEVCAPILFLAPTRDRVVPARSLATMRRAAPAMKIARVDGPHFLLQRNPAGALAAVERFLDETVAREARRNPTRPPHGSEC